MIYLSTLLLSVFITVSVLPMMIKLAGRYRLVDIPDPRKVHSTPIPRIGGIAMAFGSFFPVMFLIAADPFVKAYLVGAGVIVIFGIADDLKGLGYKAKFSGQILAALVAVYFGGIRLAHLGTLLPADFELATWIAVPMTVFVIVGVTNAINLADGLDGLAGGISILGFCCIGYLAYYTGDQSVLLIALSLAGALFGFLRFNTHPASLFMGDTGSQLLGFSSIVLCLRITQGSTALSPVLPLFILGFPILDTLTVMIERMRKGRSPFAADKNHFHHRLMRIGLSHSEAVFGIYAIQAALIVSAIFFKFYSDWLVLSAYGFFSAVIIAVFHYAERSELLTNNKQRHYFGFRDRLRNIRDNGGIIKVSFTLLKVYVPALLLLFCFLPYRIPGYASLLACCFVLLLLAGRIAANTHQGSLLRIALYLCIPLVLYFVEEDAADRVSAAMLTLYHASFGVAALFALLTMKFSRRLKGFRVTTMDFLIVFIAVVVPNLPDQMIRSYHLGPLSVEIIVMLFSFEVLITELREKLAGLSAVTVATAVVIAVRGAAGH
jgi:UDP-GlcNAc:undecaprenyl-phosphate GlcNAc-1-phosphate transferase